MKITFITTVFNEEKTIKSFLESIFAQTKLPDEIIIVDGSSIDGTVEKIENYQLKIRDLRIKYKLLVKKGNRSVGRNEAIKRSTGDIIVCSDAGNILDKKWIENIVRPFKDKTVDIVAGYYKGKAKTIFQKCLIPYVLVMPDKVDPNSFLPATRSVAFTRAIWKRIGGFNEELSHNEDYDFAKRLKRANVHIVFAQDAVVNWIPRTNVQDVFVMFFRFALGDIEAKLIRPKVLLLFSRYLFALYFVFLSVLYASLIGGSIVILSLILYLTWAVWKSYKYINEKRACLYLPIIQLTADAAVLTGSIAGFLKLIGKFHYRKYIEQHKFFIGMVLLYGGFLFVTRAWGIPNSYHPFPYHMDEWHQLQAVRATFKYGTPNTAGAANGTMFHFILSGLYLVPFTLLGVINPIVLTIDNWVMREKIFELLRINTLLWGVLSLFVFYKIVLSIHASKKLAILLFTSTPIWVMLSGYFKYDIALLFWIILALFFYLRFAKYPTSTNYLIAAIPTGLAFAVKVSAIPLFILYVVGYFLFCSRVKDQFRYFILGVSLAFFCAVIFGMPDTLFGKGNILLYLFENIIQSPATTENIQLGMNQYLYLFLRHYPIIFGHGLILIFLVSLLWLFFQFSKVDFKKIVLQSKIKLFLLFSFGIFMLSLLPLKIWAAGNRSLVLLPFMVLLVSISMRELLQSRIKNIIFGLLTITILLQLYESTSWMTVKFSKSPQEISSQWIAEHIPQKQTIGIENIPIYQNLPDIVEKEFYYDQYHIYQNQQFTYIVIDHTTKTLPGIIVLTNADMNASIYKETPQKHLLRRLNAEGYKKIYEKTPNLFFTRVFSTPEDFFMSAMVASPITTSVYKK